jgi:glutathione S-transferase
MIHFYGSPNSSAGRTLWMLEEVGSPYEYHRVNLRDEASKQALRKVNPGGKIPTIDDDGFRLFESIAINFYLAEKYKPELQGNDPKERALAYQWSLWAITNLQPEVLAIMTHSALLPEAERDPKALGAARSRVAPLLAQLDRTLAGAEYLVGGRFTVADVNTASVANLARVLGVLSSDHAHLTAYVDRMRARPAYIRAVAAG